MGGGGASGTIDFPRHIKDVHIEWLQWSNDQGNYNQDITVSSILRDGLADNPFENLTSFDPNSAMTSARSSGDAAITALNTLAADDVLTSLDSVVTKLDEDGILQKSDFDANIVAARLDAGSTLADAVQAAINAIPDDVIKKYVDGVDHRLSGVRNRSRHRVNITMAESRSLHTSSYMMALAMVEAEHLRSLADADRELRSGILASNIASYLDSYRTSLAARIDLDMRDRMFRNQVAITYAELVARSKADLITHRISTTSGFAEIARMEYLLKNEYQVQNATFKEMRYNYLMELYQKGANILAAPTGAASVLPPTNSKFGSAVGGALVGASALSFLGPPGAAVGGILGGISGYMNA